MIVKLIAFAVLSMLTVDGQESSLAAAHQSMAKSQPTAVRSDHGQRSLLTMFVGVLRPADTQRPQQDRELSSYIRLVDSDESAPATSIIPMTSITVDTPESQLSEADKERVRQEQLQQQLSAKENELAILRDKAAAATNQLSAEKTRADDLEAQLTQKEQELSGICAQRDTHQQMSQDLNRTKSSLEQVKQQVIDREREFIVANEHLDDATHRLVAKEQELLMTKSNLDKMTHTLADLDRELLDRNTQLTQAKQLLASLGRSMPKEGKPSASNKNSLSQQAGAAGRATSDLSKVSENLANALEDELKQGSVALRLRGNKLTLALASGELFALGDAAMTSTGTSLLGRIGAALQPFRNQRIEVAGHTDSIPVRSDNRRPFRDNLELSRARAQHASQTLIDSGLGADRIKTVGYAATKPLASNKTEEGRSKNRRVEIIVSPWSGAVASAGKKGEQVVSKPAQPKGTVQKIINR